MGSDDITTLEFFANKKLLNDRIQEEIKSSFTKRMFVDVSSTSPQILSSDLLVELHNRLSKRLLDLASNMSSDDIIEWTVDAGDIYPPTLIGWLLGYPFIYTNSQVLANQSKPSFDIMKNNLSMVPLDLYQLFLESDVTFSEDHKKNSNSHLIMSFSIPSHLIEKGIVDRFFSDIINKVKSHREEVKSKLGFEWKDQRLEVKNVTLPSVIL